MLLLIAGGLAALVQYWLPSTPAGPPADASSSAAGEASPPPVRQILPTFETPRPAPPPPAAASPPSSGAPQDSASPPAAVPPPALRSGSTTAAIAPVDPTPLRLPSGITASPSPPSAAIPQAEAEVAEARATEGPAAIALVDLNSASVADLNRLRGGGNIGRAIVAKRPYTAVSDLLTKRVLNRSTFERIREQVTVR